MERLVTSAAEMQGVNPEYALCIAKAESDLDPNAVGKLREVGLFQILPSTGEWIAGKWGLTTYDLTDPATNTLMGLWLIQEGYHDWYSTHPLCQHHLGG